MQPTRILIVRLSSLGDIVHTYPMVYDIKTNVPNCTIDWLVDESFVDLVRLNNLVNNVLSIPLRTWKKNKLKLISNIRQWRKQAKHLTYDYIIDSQGLLKSAFLAKCFEGPVHGFGKKSIREKIARFFYEKSYEIEKEELAITKNRLLAATIFNYTIDKETVNFGLNPVTDTALTVAQRYVIFFHATSQPSKKLAVSVWVWLAKYLINQHNLTIILPFGNDNERTEALAIKEQIDSPNVLVPETRFNFKSLTQLIYKAEFIFGVDTGLTHLANAMNKRLIAIYVDTDPKKTGIFASNIAKNLENKEILYNTERLIEMYETIMKQ